MEAKEAKSIVRDGWNVIGPRYDAHRIKNKIDKELEEFTSLLPEGGKVLDAGSGSGEPASRYLDSAGLKVLGIDLSDTMLEMARKNVPGATFMKKDILELDFEAESFDGVISLFTLFHIPKERHVDVFKNFHHILKPGGKLMINTGISESEGISTFFGVPMYWSNNHPSKTLEDVKKTGFSILFEGMLVRGGEYQYWIVAEKR